MKSNNLLFVVAAVFLASLFACGESSGSGDPGDNKSDLTPEQHKENINQVGVDFINNIEGMSDESMFAVLQHFFNLAEDYDLESEIDMKSAPVAYLRQYLVLQDNPTKAINLKSISDDEYSSLTEMYKDLTGVYTFDFDNQRWVKSLHFSEIKFVFPSAKSKTTNDAEIRIFDYDATAATNQDIEDWTYELLTSLKMEMTVDTEKYFGMSMTGTYHDDDAPKFMQSSVEMENYSWSNTFDFTNPSSEAQFNSSLKKGTEILVELDMKAEGNFTYDNIDDDLNTIDEDEGSAESINKQDIIRNANAFFRIGNLKIVGQVDVKNFIQKMTDAEELEDKAFADAMVAALNDYATLMLVYADNNEMIAETEFYVTEEEEEDYDEYGNLIYVTRYYVATRFTFSDGSALDDSYFEDGFTKLTDKINEFIDKLNRQYELELETIEE